MELTWIKSSRSDANGGACVEVTVIGHHDDIPEQP